MTKKITLRTLKAKGACRDQCKRFAALFPEGVEVTEALCIEHAAEFNWDWAAQSLLTAPALAEYEHVAAPALAEYERVKASALAEYERVKASALAEYQRTTATAWAEYDRVRASALVEYNRVRAATFAILYLRG